jgi:opacity protein-like surface antigen
MRWNPPVVAILITAIVGLAVSAAAYADNYRSRTGRWDFTIQARYLDGSSFNLDGGSRVDINSDIGWGFGFAYNFNDHLALGMDFGWNSPTYDATIVSADAPPLAPRQVNAEMETSTVHLNLLYNFIAGPVTPYVGAGLGSTYIDTNIPSGVPGTSCWWDPWYGYICYNYQPTYSDYRFSYSGAVGVRWDLNPQLFLRAAFGAVWIDMPNGGDRNFTNGRLELGFSY